MQKAQIDTLTEQSSKDTMRIQTLEAKLQSEMAQLKARESQSDDKQDSVIEGQLLQKERELQVYRWRGQSESAALATQEMFMASCFHEIGLKYHKLRTEHELVKRKLREMEKRAAGASPSPSSPGTAATPPPRTRTQ